MERLNGEQNTNPEQPAYDEHLYDAFVEVAAFQAYEYLKGDAEYRKQQKQKFLNGEQRNPNLDYPEIDSSRLQQIETSLLGQKEGLLQNEENDAVKRAYRWRLNEKIAETRLLKAVLDGDMRRFAKYSEFIYGQPSKEIFLYTVSTLKKSAQETSESNDNDLVTASLELIGVLPDVESTVTLAHPDQRTVEAASQQVHEEFGELISLPIEGEELNAEQIMEAFQRAIDLVGNTDWKVVIKDNATNISLNQEKQEVIVPASREVGKDKLVKLLVHEIGTHLVRRMNGGRSKLKLLSLGLDRYEVGEEGVTTLREQALDEEFEDFAGTPGHLAISLAQGLDGKPRDFREVYEIMEKYFVYSQVKDGADLATARQKAKNMAWNRTVRTFRGTDCSTPGVCFTKDIIYREGNINIWDVAKTNPEEMLRFNIGKYDPANPRHLYILEQLGITDEDLKVLES